MIREDRTGVDSEKDAMVGDLVRAIDAGLANAHENEANGAEIAFFVIAAIRDAGYVIVPGRGAHDRPPPTGSGDPVSEEGAGISRG